MKYLIFFLLLVPMRIHAAASGPFVYSANAAKNLAPHLKLPSVATVTTVSKAANGSTGTCTVANTSDSAGKVTLTPGGTGITTGAQCDITFAKAYTVAPICVLTDASTVGPTDGVKPYLTSTTAIMTINYVVAGTSAHVYVYYFHCIETQ